MRSFKDWVNEEHPELQEMMGGPGKKGDDFEDWLMGEEPPEGTVSAPTNPAAAARDAVGRRLASKPKYSTEERIKRAKLRARARAKYEA